MKTRLNMKKLFEYSAMMPLYSPAVFAAQSDFRRPWVTAQENFHAAAAALWNDPTREMAAQVYAFFTSSVARLAIMSSFQSGT